MADFLEGWIDFVGARMRILWGKWGHRHDWWRCKKFVIFVRKERIPTWIVRLTFVSRNLRLPNSVMGKRPGFTSFYLLCKIPEVWREESAQKRGTVTMERSYSRLQSQDWCAHNASNCFGVAMACLYAIVQSPDGKRTSDTWTGPHSRQGRSFQGRFLGGCDRVVTPNIADAWTSSVPSSVCCPYN